MEKRTFGVHFRLKPAVDTHIKKGKGLGIRGGVRPARERLLGGKRGWGGGLLLRRGR